MKHVLWQNHADQVLLLEKHWLPKGMQRNVHLSDFDMKVSFFQEAKAQSWCFT